MSYVKIIVQENGEVKWIEYITRERLIHCRCPSTDKNDINTNNNNKDSGDFIELRKPTTVKVPILKTDRFLLSLFIKELFQSTTYRTSLINYCILHNQTKKIRLKVILKQSTYQPIDYRWNERMAHLARERCELDNIMSWLSTLGGAFSALGDHFTNCADIAGQISIHQFKLALRLGDPLTVARCKLFLSLSLIQKERFKFAKRIILQQYELAKSNVILDTRLVKMCQGIWCKLKYERAGGNVIKKRKNVQIKIGN